MSEVEDIMTDAENVSEKRVEAAHVAYENARKDWIEGKGDSKGWPLGWFATRAALLADAPHAASRYADGVREGLRIARDTTVNNNGLEIRMPSSHAAAIDARIKEGK